jgi:hypothetical protein
MSGAQFYAELRASGLTYADDVQARARTALTGILNGWPYLGMWLHSLAGAAQRANSG